MKVQRGREIFSRSHSQWQIWDLWPGFLIISSVFSPGPCVSLVYTGGGPLASFTEMIVMTTNNLEEGCVCDLTEGCVLVFNHSVNCVRFFATPQTLARQAPLSVEFSRQKYWSGLPFPTPYRWVGEEKILGWFRFRKKHPKWRKWCFDKKKTLGYRNGRVTVPLTSWSSAPAQMWQLSAHWCPLVVWRKTSFP